MIGRTYVDVTVEKMDLVLSCYVVDKLIAPVVMGVDMLTKYNCQVDFTRNELSLLDGRVTVPLVHHCGTSLWPT